MKINRRFQTFYFLLLASALPSLAADLYWDSNGGTANTGGNGTWHNANTWRTGSATGTLGSWTDGNNAIFGGSVGTVTVNSDVNATGITFATSGYVIAAASTGTITLASGAIVNTGSVSINIDSILKGELNITGGGNTTGTRIAGNNLDITATTINLTSGNGALIMIPHANALGGSSSTLKLTKGAINLGEFSTAGVGINYNTGATELAGGRIRARVGQSTWNGAITLTAPSEIESRGAAGVGVTVASTINLDSHKLTLICNNAGNGITLNGAISGTGGNIEKTGSTQLTLAGANTFTGTTAIKGGTFNLTGSLAGPVTLDSGTTMNLTGSLSGSLNAANGSQITGEGTSSSSIVLNGASTIRFDPNSPAALTADTVSVDSLAAVSILPTTTPPNATGIVVINTTNGITGDISNFSFTGRGTLSFSGDNKQLLFDYAPVSIKWKGADAVDREIWDTNTTVNWVDGTSNPEKFFTSDVVTFDDSASFFSVYADTVGLTAGNITINNSTNPYTFSGGTVSSSGTFVKNGTAKATIANTFNIAGGISINAGTIQLGNGSANTGSFGSSNIVNNGTLITDYGTNTVSFTSAISGTGTFTQQGAGIVALTADNTYTGITTINAGATLQLGNASNTGSVAGEISNNGTLSFSRAFAFTVANAISGSGNITHSTNSAAVTTLSGNNTFTGTVTIANSRELIVGSNTALGSASNLTESVWSGHTSVTGSGRVILANGVTVTGEMIRIGTAASVNNNFNGALQTAGSATWAGPVLLDSTDARIGAATNGTLHISGVIQDGLTGIVNFSAGMNSITTNETGTVLLSGANTYTGVTNIVRGTVKLGANNSLPVTTTLDIDNLNTADNSAFDLNGFDQTVAVLQRTSAGGGTGTAFLTNSSSTKSTFTVNQATTGTYSGRTTGNLDFVKDNTGALTLSFIHAPTGNTTINGGSLIFADNSNTTFYIGANGVNNQINGSGTLQVNGDFIIDTSLADTTAGNSWTLVNVDTLTETFGTTFQVIGFTETALGSGIWKKAEGALQFTFSTSNGKLTVAPASAYDLWATDNGLTLANNAATADPDGDGQNNLAEFAFDGDPLSAADRPKTFSSIADSDADVDANKELVLTIAVRAGAPTFSGSPLSSTVDGVTYNVHGSADLADFSSSVVNVPTALVDGLPALSSGDYEYRSFSLSSSNGLPNKGFLRAQVTQP